jgi:5-methylcytosine-specific restriction protein B
MDHLRRGIDAQIIQKLLTKLHGSRRKLEPVLSGVGVLCLLRHTWSEKGLMNATELVERSRAASRIEDLNELQNGSQSPFYSLSYEKVRRMLDALDKNGFASFAEA